MFRFLPVRLVLLPRAGWIDWAQAGGAGVAGNVPRPYMKQPASVLIPLDRKSISSETVRAAEFWIPPMKVPAPSAATCSWRNLSARLSDTRIVISTIVSIYLFYFQLVRRRSPWPASYNLKSQLLQISLLTPFPCHAPWFDGHPFFHLSRVCADFFSSSKDLLIVYRHSHHPHCFIGKFTLPAMTIIEHLLQNFSRKWTKIQVPLLPANL